MIFLVSLSLLFQTTFEEVSFSSKDGVTVTGDLYKVHDHTAPFILLFHQAGSSRGEYREIAPKLNAMGFNCLALDQRSGNAMNGVKNITVASARRSAKSTSFLDAYQDMEAALAYVKENFATGKVIIWGSSYSSSLVFRLAAEHAQEVHGILSFSPGEYFSSLGNDYIQGFAKDVNQPLFVTSTKNEKGSWWKIYEKVPSENKTYFLPESGGNHGARALWEKSQGHQRYWEAVDNFLTTHFQRIVFRRI